MSYSHDIMRALDAVQAQGSTKVKPAIYYAIRHANRKANMRGRPVQSERELAKLAFDELANGR